MIAALRAQLAADLAVLDVPVVEQWPNRVTPPVIFLTPPASGSYVAGGPTFGSYTCSIDVVILVDRAVIAAALSTLEDLVEGVLTNSVDWSLDGVDSPSLVTIGASEYLGTIAHLSKPSRL